MPISQAELAERLQRLRESYAAKLASRVQEIGLALKPLIEGTWSTSEAETAARLSHNLAGTGQTFGFPEVGAAARRLEDLLLGWRGAEGALPVDYRRTLAQGVEKLYEVSRSAGVEVTPVTFDFPAEMRALIVDDDADMRGLLETVAEAHQLEVTGCSSAEAAWEAFGEREYNLVLLDLMLPGMDGVEFCRKLRAHPRGQSTEILIVTARKSAADLQAVLDAGADDYIAKPVDPELLGVRIVIAHRNAQNLVARARAESKLRETEHRLGAVVSAAPITIFSLDPKGRVTLMRGTALGEFLGGDSDPNGATLEDLLAGFPNAQAATKRALGNAPADAVLERGGRVLELRLTPMAGVGEGGAVSGVATEVTERVRMQRRLRETIDRVERANADLVEILDRLQAGIVVVESDSRVSHMSRMAAELFRLDASAASGEFWHDALPLSTDAKAALAAISAAPQSERARTTVQVDAPNGRRRTLSVDVVDDPREEGRTFLVFYDESEVHDLRRILDDRSTFHDLVGQTPEMRSVYDQIRDFASVSWTVLVQGETGTGKELVAHAIHSESPRKGKPFIAVNCAGLSVSLLQSQLFGHRKGAFTGATQDQAGYFESAHGGTLFLDEIGDISPEVQTSLLRVLEEGEITRVGESRPRKVDVRVIAATHRDLQHEVARGNFRADLMYRIRVARITLPPLRERRADIPLLVNRFIERARAATGRAIEGVSDTAMTALMEYGWPGNVRELRSAVDFGAVRSRGEFIDLDDLPPELKVLGSGPTPVVTIPGEDEATRIRHALERAGGNRTKAARLLGISRATFYRRLSELGIEM